MPDVEDGAVRAVGVWPLKRTDPDSPVAWHKDDWPWPKEKEYYTSGVQAPYLTLIKRHYDAICIAHVRVRWPDESQWGL